MKAINLIAQQKYQSRLVVILWDVQATEDAAKQNLNWIEAKLLENNIPTLKLSREIHDADFKNWIIKRDGHPNPRAYREVAQILLSWLEKNRLAQQWASPRCLGLPRDNPSTLCQDSRHGPNEKLLDFNRDTLAFQNLVLSEG